jgi:hypothetical protein
VSVTAPTEREETSRFITNVNQYVTSLSQYAFEPEKSDGECEKAVKDKAQTLPAHDEATVATLEPREAALDDITSHTLDELSTRRLFTIGPHTLGNLGSDATLS